MNRVVITGMGCITPIGKNVNEFEIGLKQGKNGIKLLTRVTGEGLKVHVAGEIADFNPEDYFDKKQARRMDRCTQFCLAASDEAISSSGLDFEHEDTCRAGVYIATGIGGITTLTGEQEKCMAKGARGVSPFMVPMMIANMPAGEVSIKYKLKGASMAHVTACASSTHAIGEGFRSIKHGYHDIIIAGGTEAAINIVSIAGFQNMTALSTSEDVNAASLPFDRRRGGFVMGEGAGVVVLESYDHAVARGAKIYGEIVGYGATTDAYHITSPSPDGEGAARAMKLAIEEAGVSPEDIDYVNAHGTGTPLNDKFETLAIKSALGEDTEALVNSTKSMTGHLLGATGAVEAVASLLELNGGFVHPTINLSERDEECGLNVVSELTDREIKYALSNSLGFGGHNASILLKKV